MVVAASTADLISPILLERARAISEEHGQLSVRNVENYDVTVAKKIGELGPVTEALRDWENAQNVYGHHSESDRQGK